MPVVEPEVGVASVISAAREISRPGSWARRASQSESGLGISGRKHRGCGGSVAVLIDEDGVVDVIAAKFGACATSTADDAVSAAGDNGGFVT